MSWIGAIILLSVLVFVHEMGHLLAGLAVGIKAEAFSIGFGPIIFRKTIKGIDFRFSVIPFGGYCKFKGEMSEDGKVEPEGKFLLQKLRFKFSFLKQHGEKKINKTWCDRYLWLMKYRNETQIPQNLMVY